MESIRKVDRYRLIDVGYSKEYTQRDCRAAGSSCKCCLYYCRLVGCIETVFARIAEDYRLIGSEVESEVGSDVGSLTE